MHSVSLEKLQFGELKLDLDMGGGEDKLNNHSFKQTYHQYIHHNKPTLDIIGTAKTFQIVNLLS